MYSNTRTNNTSEKTRNAVANNIAIQTGTADQKILQQEDNRPEAIDQRNIQEAAMNSPQVKQLKATQAMANNSPQVKKLRAVQKMANSNQKAKKTEGISTGKTIQGYFLLDEKKTNNKTEFPDEDIGDMWENLKVEFRKTPALSDPLLDEYKVFIMEWARDDKKWTFEKAKGLLKNIAAAKLKGEKSISAESPTGMTSVIPELVGEKEKHTSARYTFADESKESGKATELLDLDKYTKKGDSDLTAGTWAKADILFALRFWSCKAPLVQHLAQFVLPKLKKTDRKWEMYLREMERVLGERIAESKNREFSIRSKNQTKTVNFERKTFEVEARAKVQEKLLAGTAPPGSQNEIPFFDDLIRAKLDKEGVSNWYTTEKGTQLEFDSGKIDKNPGMTLVHWRTILLFDWQTGNEIWKNGV